MRDAGVLLVPIALALAVAPVWAQQWQIRPNANVELGYDDNVRTSEASQQGSFVTRARAGMRAIRSTESTNLAMAAGVSLNGFADAADLDNTTGLLGIDWAYDAERNRFGLNLSFDTQSTLTSELATTGLTQINKQRYQLGVRPSWSYSISERSSLSVALSYTDVIYEDVDEIPLFNYRQGNLTLGGSYRLSERAGLNVNLVYGRYDAEGVTNETENLSAQLGADYLLSETMRLAFLIGLRRTEATSTDLTGLSVTESSSGPSYRISFSKQLASGGSLSAQAVREVVPSGSAEVLDTTSLTFGFSHPFSERWRLSANATANHNRQAGGEASLSDRQSATGRLSVSYTISEDWRLSASYSHRWQQRDELQGKAHANAIFLTLAWSRPWNL